jgi:hypothetical protein
MNRLFLFLLSSFAMASSAFALARSLDVESALQEADLIARITVTSVGDAPKGSGYEHLATATVTNSVKGLPAGATLSILSDNGYICPNVVYGVGDDCIVFAKRRRDGSFETMNTLAGRFRVQNGNVRYYSFHRISTQLAMHGSDEDIRKEFERTAPAEQILTELRERLKNSK